MKSDGTKVPTQMLELLPEIVIPKSFQKTNYSQTRSSNNWHMELIYG